uniref:Cyclin-dependent kinase inhibitor n=1 Tax=Steinernema glaseri TaxID=37863 RepID=A0A1I7ZS87_9BILA
MEKSALLTDHERLRVVRTAKRSLSLGCLPKSRVKRCVESKEEIGSGLGTSSEEAKKEHTPETKRPSTIPVFIINSIASSDGQLQILKTSKSRHKSK